MRLYNDTRSVDELAADFNAKRLALAAAVRERDAFLWDIGGRIDKAEVEVMAAKSLLHHALGIDEPPASP